MNRPAVLAAIIGVLSLGAFLPAHRVAAEPVAYPTSYVEMVHRLVLDQRRSSLIDVTTIGRSGKHHRPILLVQLGRSNPSALRIMVLCRQHGDEPPGTEGALSVIESVSKNPGAARLFRGATFFIVPMVNPDGAEALTRLSGNQADLNRDWGVFHQPETAAVRNAVRKIRPEFILDVHSWDSIDNFQQICLEGPRVSSLVGSKMLLAIADLQGRAAYGVGGITNQTIAATTYGDDAEPTLAHRYFLRRDHIASLLFETAPGPNYGPSLQSRTALVASMLNWLIRDTTVHPDAWKRIVLAEPAFNRSSEYRTQLVVTRLPVPVTIHKLDRSGWWVAFVSACLLAGWLGLRSPITDPGWQIKAPVRFRRLSNRLIYSPIRLFCRKKGSMTVPYKLSCIGGLESHIKLHRFRKFEQ